MDTKAIRDALAAATPGKWEVLAVGGDVISDKVVVYRAGISIAKGISSKNDSLLIANAPTWLQQLLDENERITADFETLKGNYRQLSGISEQLQADKAVAVEALQKALEIDGYMFVKEALERIESGEKNARD